MAGDSLTKPPFGVTNRREQVTTICNSHIGQRSLITWDSVFDDLPYTAPENCWLEGEIPFRMAYFQVRTVSFREDLPKLSSKKWLQSWTAFRSGLPLVAWPEQNLAQRTTWRVIPLSKWLVTPIYKPFRPFIRGTPPFRGLTNHGY